MRNILSSRFDLARAALLGAAAFGVFHAAVACGRVKVDDTGSETHWLARCDSDLDCAEGSCECGVCSRPCDAVSDCSELGVAGIQCTQDAARCDAAGAAQGGTAPAAGARACLLPCTRDADCAALGEDAACREQRCELPKTSIISDGSGGQSNTTGGAGGASGGSAGDGSIGGQGGSGQPPELATLCDGSEDVRLAYVVAGGFVDPFYPFFSDVYGHASFVIDGQCRFWETRSDNGWVYSGTLDAARAQEFAEAIGYGSLSDYGSFVDPPCPDGAISTLASPEGSIRCSCQCTTNSQAPAGWLRAFRGISSEARAALFASGETVTGPARMVLLTPRTLTNGVGAGTWPLQRPPANSEMVINDGNLFLTATSGVLIEDTEELAAFRQLRADFFAARPDSSFRAVPVVYADAVIVSQFDLFWRDEVPEKVRAALVSAAQ